MNAKEISISIESLKRIKSLTSGLISVLEDCQRASSTSGMESTIHTHLKEIAKNGDVVFSNLGLLISDGSKPDADKKDVLAVQKTDPHTVETKTNSRDVEDSESE